MSASPYICGKAQCVNKAIRMMIGIGTPSSQEQQRSHLVVLLAIVVETAV
jgi:hypothetical protein